MFLLHGARMIPHVGTDLVEGVSILVEDGSIRESASDGKHTEPETRIRQKEFAEVRELLGFAPDGRKATLGRFDDGRIIRARSARVLAPGPDDWLQTCSEIMRNGGELLVESRAAAGATKSFGVPGESYLAVLDALHDMTGELDFVLCRNQGGSAFMTEALTPRQTLNAMRQAALSTRQASKVPA